MCGGRRPEGGPGSKARGEGGADMAGFRGKLAALDAGVRNAWLLTAT